MTMLAQKVVGMWLSMVVGVAILSESSSSVEAASLIKGNRLRKTNHTPLLEERQHRADQRRRAVKGINPQQKLFLDTCRRDFKSKSVVDDGIISQNDFSTEYVALCEHFTVDNDATFQCPEPDFTALPVSIQLVFAFALCPESDPMSQRKECVASLDSLSQMETEFGFIATSDRFEQVSEDVEQLCFGLFPFVFRKLFLLLCVQLSPFVFLFHVTRVFLTKYALCVDIIFTAGEDLNPGTEDPTFSASDAPSQSGSQIESTLAPTSAKSEMVAPSAAPSQLSTVGNTTNSFVSNGGPAGGITNKPLNDLVGRNEQLGRGSIIGIAVAAAVILVCCLGLLGRRRRRSRSLEENSLGKRVFLVQEAGDGSSIDTEGSPELKFSNVDAMADTGAVYQPEYNLRSVNQFDPKVAPSAIAFGRRGSNSSNASAVSSILNRSKTSGATKTGPSVEQVMLAVDNASWDDVYTLASQLAEREDLSTLSSGGKARRQNLERKKRTYLSAEDQERCRTLDELIENGDWTGVAVTAALFAGESGSNARGAGAANATAKDSRSLLERISGKRTSSTSRAASQAATEDNPVPPASAFPHSSIPGNYHDESTIAGTTAASYVTPPRSPPNALAGQQTVKTPGTPDTFGTLDTLRNEIDQAVDIGNWDQVLLLSSKVEADASFRANMAELAKNSPSRSVSGESSSTIPPEADQSIAYLEAELDRSIYFGDWAMVTYFANRIIQKRGAGGSEDGSAAQSSALVPMTMPTSNFPSSESSVDTDGSMANKKLTIERLAKAKSFKGVSIMAGLYALETKMSKRSGDIEIPSADSADYTASSGPGWMNMFSGTGRTSQDTGATRSTTPGWMGLVNLASATDDSWKAGDRAQQYPTQPTPPALKEREEVQLRSIEQDSSLSSDADVRPPPTKLSLHGAKDLIPYWKSKEKGSSESVDIGEGDRKPAASP
jgi:hypothetical protein